MKNFRSTGQLTQLGAKASFSENLRDRFGYLLTRIVVLCPLFPRENLWKPLGNL